jgi:pimeloyl-ACP methyl ester carboxylesterase
MTATDAFVTANGLRFHYRDWGGRGQPVVLLHGLASTARIWDFVAPLLADAGRVIALDQRGHGGSDRSETGYSFAEVTADLVGVLDALGFARPVMVGHSWGASVAVSFAVAHPDRAVGIALVDGGTMSRASRPGITWEEFERMMAPPRLAGTPRTRLLERMRSGDLRDIWSPAVEEAIMAGFEVFPDDTIAPRLSFERHMQIVRAIWDYHPSELLPRVACPTLIMPAIRDGDIDWTRRKREGVALAERLLPRARTVWLEDSIHDVPLQRPALVAELLRGFVRELGQAEPAAAGG